MARSMRMPVPSRRGDVREDDGSRNRASPPTPESRVRYPPCALILVDCLVMEAAPNGPICMGQQLAGLKLRCRTGDRGSNGVSGLITPGVMAWRESWRDDRDAGSPVSVPGWPGGE